MEGLDIDVYFQNGQRGIMCNVELGNCEWFGSIYGYFQNWLGGVIVWIMRNLCWVENCGYFQNVFCVIYMQCYVALENLGRFGSCCYYYIN